MLVKGKQPLLTVPFLSYDEIGQNILDTYAGKQLTSTATDV
jgi:hypothetical protein